MLQRAAALPSEPMRRTDAAFVPTAGGWAPNDFTCPSRYWCCSGHYFYDHLYPNSEISTHGAQRCAGMIAL
jgi:hypothetical protein